MRQAKAALLATTLSLLAAWVLGSDNDALTAALGVLRAQVRPLEVSTIAPELPGQLARLNAALDEFAARAPADKARVAALRAEVESLERESRGASQRREPAFWKQAAGRVEAIVATGEALLAAGPSKDQSRYPRGGEQQEEPATFGERFAPAAGVVARLADATAGGRVDFDRSGVRDAVASPPRRAETADRPAAPLRYFTFSAERQLSPAEIAQLARGGRYGSDILIGGSPYEEGFDAAMAAADRLGLKKHVYLQGPGGPTGNGGIDPEERRRMVREAASVGLDLDSAAGRAEWNRSGWVKVHRQHLLHMKQENEKAGRPQVYSVEFDNMDRSYGQDPAATVEFYRRHEAWMRQNGVQTRLLLKNQSAAQLRAIKAAVDAGVLSRSTFADFHISEPGGGDPAALQRLSAELCIQTIRSGRTEHYAARGSFDLRCAR